MVSIVSSVTIVCIHVDRVRHEAADGTQVRVTVRLQDDAEVGTLPALDVDGPEKLALMAFWHFYNLPPEEIIGHAHNLLFPGKEIAQRA
jgi:hypothetical protein